MSIVTCYARLTRQQLDDVASSLDGLTTLLQSPPDDSEVMDLDKASGVIAWLLSPCKRVEEMDLANIYRRQEDFLTTGR